MHKYIKDIIVILIYFLNNIKCEFASNVIDMDDILSEDFMPGTLLVLENPDRGPNNFNESFNTLQSKKKMFDGSFGNAMETMNFHRSMMNQYLCRNYVAEQIISDMTTSRIKRRMGHVTPGSETATKSTKFQIAVQNNLLNDEGSASYKDWLSKSTTLEDIYRHYDQAQNRIDGEIIEEDGDEEFDEEYNGHVTGHVYPGEGHGQTPAKHRGHTGSSTYYTGGGGYSYPNPTYHHGGGSGYHHGGGAEEYSHGGGSGGYSHGGSSGYHSSGSSGYHHNGGSEFSQDNHHEYGGSIYTDHEAGGDGHSAYGGGHAIQEHEHVYHSYPPKYQGHHEEGHSEKEHDLSDLFDIALTALAFLSFGLFIVHVIMCISAAHNNSTTTAASMMMPMSMSPTATATGGMMTNTGTGGGGGMTATGGGGTDTAMGGGTETGAGDGNTGGGMTGTGSGGDQSPGTSTGGGATGTGMGGDSTGAGADGATTGGDGAGATGGGTNTGGGTTGDASPGTGTGTGGGTPGTGGGTTGTGGGTTGTGGGTTGTGGGMTGTGGGMTGTGGGTPGTGGGTTGTGGGTSPGDGDGGTGGGNGGTGDGTIRDTFKFRLKRDIPTITNPNNQALNELARRVLVSIEAAMVANSDDGVCLRKSLCENNKFSRTLDGKDKIIIPIWSLGMSWLSGRLVKSISPATSMLDTLKASILGLGKANCEIIYQECDLTRERIKRKRRRRRK